MNDIFRRISTPWSTVCLEKPKSPQLINTFSTLYGTWKFMAMFTAACHLCPSWARSIQLMTSHHTRCILILSSINAQVFQAVSFLHILPNPVRISFLACTSATTMFSGGDYKSWSSVLCKLLTNPVTPLSWIQIAEAYCYMYTPAFQCVDKRKWWQPEQVEKIWYLTWNYMQWDRGHVFNYFYRFCMSLVNEFQNKVHRFNILPHIRRIFCWTSNNQ
jgi:hypothetical protein